MVPDFAPLIANAHALSEAGRYSDALKLVASELSAYPGDGELLFARASILFDWGRIREASSGFLQAEAHGVTRTALYLNLAWSHQLLGMADKAEPFVLKAIGLDPSNAAARFGLGTVLQGQKRYPEAISSFERALDIAPDHAQAAAGIARCKLEQRDHAGAEAWMRKAIALEPGNPMFWINLGAAMANLGRYEEALEALHHAAQAELAQGALPTSMADTGFALAMSGRYAEALAVFRKNLPKLPDLRAHGYYAFVLLDQGQLREGWEQYEFRWMQEPHLSRRPDFREPPWAGQDVAGKTILLIAEQGVGDIIHFARFAAILKAMGATIILQVRPELKALAKGFDGVTTVFAPPETTPPFDFHIHLMSIPRVLGIELATIPAVVPYLREDPDRARPWSSRIGGPGLNVGVAWAGNPLYPRDQFRSIALEKLSDLLDIQGVSFFSLQRPLKDGELEKFPVALTNLEPDLADFADTAAAIGRLDLVICVDTAIAHLAGAMGKPVWLMLPEIGDFRWLEGREDSPWYPSMRLFRQRVLGQWDEVVARVKAALQEAVRTSSLTAPTGAAQSPAIPAHVVSGAADTLLERTLSPENNGIARVAETRDGIIQYLPDASRSARSVGWYGEYLQPQLDLLSRLAGPGACVIEAGSGVGEHAIALAKWLGPRGHLLVYETRPIVALMLRQNLGVNKVAAMVTVMRRDIGGPRDRPTEAADVAAGSASPSATTETVDDLLLDRLDLLKIRSAANTMEVLAGAADTLWRLRPKVFVSVTDAATVEELAGKVGAFGYRCWRMETPLFNPANFNRRDTDIFEGGSAVALIGIPEEADAAVALDGCVEVTRDANLPDSPRSPQADPVHDSSAQSRDSTRSGKLGLLRRLRNLIR